MLKFKSLVSFALLLTLMVSNSWAESVDEQAPVFSLPDIYSGEQKALEQYRGRVAYLDFWASWCGPCRRENPSVVKAYNKYKKSGFEVYSVSLDKDKNRWMQAIKQDGLIWPSHVSDLKQWRSAATGLYGFRGIPYTVLIDKEGKIIVTRLKYMSSFLFHALTKTASKISKQQQD